MLLLSMNTYVSSSSVSGWLSGPRDVLWERALASLPEPLLRAPLDADLTDASTLQNYPRMDGHVLEEMFDWGGAGAVDTASSDAASSRTGWSTYGHRVPAQVPEWRDEERSGDPKTDHASSVITGGDPKTVHASSKKGGDPRTDHASLVTASFTTDRGGDPITDHSLCTNARVGGDSPRLGELATQTAISDPDAPGLNPGFAVSRGMDPVHSNGFPHSQISEVHDVLPST